MSYLFQSSKFRLDYTDRIRIGMRTAYRLIATASFADVKTGDKGGYIEGSYNLSHAGTCWIYPGCAVLGLSKIEDHAVVYNTLGDTINTGLMTMITDSSIIGRARVGDSIINGDSVVSRSAEVKETLVNQTMITEDAKVKKCALYSAGRILTSLTNVLFNSGKLEPKFPQMEMEGAEALQ